jgi:hypothetical protein
MQQPHLQDTPDISSVPENDMKRFEDYSRQELLEMSWDEFQRILGTEDPQKMTQDQLIISMQRKGLNPK